VRQAAEAALAATQVLANAKHIKDAGVFVLFSAPRDVQLGYAHRAKRARVAPLAVAVSAIGEVPPPPAAGRAKGAAVDLRRGVADAPEAGAQLEVFVRALAVAGGALWAGCAAAVVHKVPRDTLVARLCASD